VYPAKLPSGALPKGDSEGLNWRPARPDISQRVPKQNPAQHPRELQGSAQIGLPVSAPVSPRGAIKLVAPPRFAAGEDVSELYAPKARKRKHWREAAAHC
jgi:hypothetical protein